MVAGAKLPRSQPAAEAVGALPQASPALRRLIAALLRPDAAERPPAQVSCDVASKSCHLSRQVWELCLSSDPAYFVHSQSNCTALC